MAAAASLGRALAGEEAAAGDDTRGSGSGTSFIADLVAGWREFTSITWLWVMVVGVAFFLFAIDGPIQVLGPIVARDVYDGARTWGFTSAAMGIGQIVGGLLSLRWRPRRPMLVISAGMSLAAVPVALLALEAPVWTLYLSLGVMGVQWGLYDTFWTTCMQREVEPAMISRVSSYDYLGSLAFYPAGLALAGPLADLLGITTVLWISAGVAILVSVFQLSWRDVRAPREMGPRRGVVPGARRGTADGQPGRRRPRLTAAALPATLSPSLASLWRRRFSGGPPWKRSATSAP